MEELLEQELREVYTALTRAELQRDVPMLERLLADEYLGVDPAGDLLDRRHVLETYTEGRVVLKKLESDELVVRLFGDTGVIVGRSHISGVTPEGRFQGEFRFTDVYLRREGEWQLVSSHTTPLGRE